jgi:hypothetical protein
VLFDFCFFVKGMFPVEFAVLLQFQFALGIFLVFLGRVIFAFTFRTLKRYKFNGFAFSCHETNSFLLLTQELKV